MASSKLNARQLSFIDNYCLTLNATDAAIKAGYSPKTAQEQASRLLSNVMLASNINQRLKATAEKKGDLRERLLEMLESVAMAKVSDFGRIGPSGIEFFNEEDIDPKKLCAITEFNVYDKGENGVSVKFKLSDRLKAAELLMKHMGMLKDRLEIEVTPKPTVIRRLNGEVYELGINEYKEKK